MRRSLTVSYAGERAAVLAALLLLAPMTVRAQALGPMRVVSDPAFKSRYPAVAAEAGGQLDLVWQDESRGRIVFSRTSDGGATFQPEVIVGSGDSPGVGVGADGTIYAAWRNTVPYIARSTDGGVTFSPPLQIGTDGINNSLDVTVTGSGVVIVIWTTTSAVIQLVRSVDSGLTFAAPETLSSATQPSYYPRIASSGSQVQAAWTTFVPPSYGSEIRTRASADEGVTFAPPVLLASAAGGGSQSACVSIGAAGTFVGWYDQEGPIGLRRSVDQGGTFAPPWFPLPVFPGGAPDVAADDAGDVYLSADSSYDVVMCFSPDSGGVFSLPEHVYPSAALSGLSRLRALPGRSAAVVWEEGITTANSYIALRIVGAAPTGVAPSNPSRLRLAVWPNPARVGEPVHIAAHPEFEALTISDLQGRVLRRWSRAARASAPLEWDMRDGSGRRVRGGVYLVREVTAGRSLTAKIVGLQ